MRSREPAPEFLPHALVLAGLLEVPLGLQEAALSQDHAPGILALRAGLAVLLATVGMSLGKTSSDALRRGVANLVLSVAVLGSVPVLLWRGGVESAPAWLLTGMPLFVALVVADVRSILVNALVVAIAGALGAVWSAADPLALLPWGLHLSVSTVAATWACRAWTELCAFRRKQERERLESMKRMSEIERSRAHEERLASLGRMVSGLAHEINNPLAVIRANVEYMVSVVRGDAKGVPSQEQLDVLTDARDSAARIQRLVADMRAFTRKEDGTSRSDVLAAVESSARLAGTSTAQPVPIRIANDGGRPLVGIGTARVEQALVAVLLNAVEAAQNAPAGRDPGVDVDVRVSGAEVRIRIADTGSGIPEEDLVRVFDPFFTTKEPGKGTGLGLAVAREYVSQAGGRITAGNAPGSGAVIEVSLPIASGTDTDRRTPASPTPA